MAKVIHNGITTEHETAIELSARLAACCTFYFADTRDMMRKQGRTPGDLRVCWIVLDITADTWRVCDPQAWLEDHEEVVDEYTINGRKSEGEIGRELLKLITTEGAPK